jgi:hypothetical protein
MKRKTKQNMNKWLKIGLFGFCVWLIPFLFGFLFYDNNGNLIIDVIFFKTIMLIVSALTGASFMVLYFNKLKKDYLKAGIRIGAFWFLINILMDILVLIPMANLDIWTYLAQIGLRYVIIPIMSISIGIVAQNS